MLKPGDFVRYIGHTNKCLGRDCCDLMDAPFLLNKVMQVVGLQPSTSDPGLRVEYGGDTYGFLESHVLLVHEIDDRYQAGVLEGLRQAAAIAESEICVCKTEDTHDGCCASCGRRIAEIIRSNIKSK